MGQKDVRRLICINKKLSGISEKVKVRKWLSWLANYWDALEKLISKTATKCIVSARHTQKNWVWCDVWWNAQVFFSHTYYTSFNDQNVQSRSLKTIIGPRGVMNGVYNQQRPIVAPFIMSLKIMTSKSHFPNIS